MCSRTLFYANHELIGSSIREQSSSKDYSTKYPFRDIVINSKTYIPNILKTHELLHMKM